MTNSNLMSPRLDQESAPGLLDLPEIKELIEDRHIAPEHLQLIEQLNEFNYSYFEEYHNFFHMLKERSLAQLENKLKEESNEAKQKFIELLIEFTQRYNHAASMQMVPYL